MQIKSRTYVHNGVTVREQMVPHMFVVVDTYHPFTSITPWDCYGSKHMREIQRVLATTGIESVSLVESHTRNTPVGTGPNGRVRFGDNMMPSIYRVAVPKHDAPAAQTAIAAHKAEIDKWINGDRITLPLACIG